MRINEFKERLSLILENSNMNDKDKEFQLSALLSEIAQVFSIPLFYSEEFEERNKDVMTVFNEVSNKIQEYQRKSMH